MTSSCCDNFNRFFSTDLLKALGDPNRIALLSRAAECCRPCSVNELAGCCPVDLSVVSRHLATLKDAGVLKAEKQGRQVFYTVRYRALSKTLRSMAEAIDACCPTSTQEAAAAAQGGEE
jgi:ArsR family transcriptional regulator